MPKIGMPIVDEIVDHEQPELHGVAAEGHGIPGPSHDLTESFLGFPLKVPLEINHFKHVSLGFLARIANTGIPAGGDYDESGMQHPRTVGVWPDSKEVGRTKNSRIRFFLVNQERSVRLY